MGFFRDNLLYIASLIIVTSVVFGNIFGNEFVWDDQFFITDWQAIRSWSSLPDVLAGALPPQFSGAFRPGLILLYLIYYQVFGTNPLGWHIQSVAVHVTNTLLVYFILKLLMRKNAGPFPFFGGVIFGVHPIHTEAVTYIAASINTVGVLFFLAAFLSYVKRRYVFALLLAIAAFFTYEFTLTLPVILLLYHWCMEKKKITDKKSIMSVLPFFAGVGGYVIARSFAIHTLSRGTYLLGSFYLTMLAMSKVFLAYIGLLVMPLFQSVNHTLPGGIVSGYYIDLKEAAVRNQSILDPETLAAIVMIGIIGVIGWKVRKKIPLASFGIGWFFITLLPASNIIPVQELMAERYLYIPSFGFLLAFLGCIRYGITLENNRIAKRMLVVGGVALIFLYSVLTIARNAVWATPITLWEDTVKKSPTGEIAYYNLGNAYREKGEFDKAIDAYRRAIANKPKSMGSFINMGTIYMERGEYPQALASFQSALAIDPRDPANRARVEAALEALGRTGYNK